MSKRDELAAVLSWSSGEFTRWSLDAHPDHNRWSWQGNGHGEGARRPFREQADAVLTWLGEQFDEGLREGVMLGIAGTQKPCRKAIRDNGGCVTDFGPCLCASETDAALAAAREHLGLSDAAQDAQNGARTASEVEGGAGCHSGAARPGESRRESENER